jgi:hemin uptake protein HemP
MNINQSKPQRETLHARSRVNHAMRLDHPFLPPQIVESSALLGKALVRQILHNGQVYTLRQTRAGKLILTK